MRLGRSQLTTFASTGLRSHRLCSIHRRRSRQIDWNPQARRRGLHLWRNRSTLLRSRSSPRSDANSPFQTARRRAHPVPFRLRKPRRDSPRRRFVHHLFHRALWLTFAQEPTSTPSARSTSVLNPRASSASSAPTSSSSPSSNPVSSRTRTTSKPACGLSSSVARFAPPPSPLPSSAKQLNAGRGIRAAR